MSGLFYKWYQDIHVPKNKTVVTLPHTASKNQLKMYPSLPVRTKTIKILEENISINLHDLGLKNIFLAMNPKVQINQTKVDN